MNMLRRTIHMIYGIGSHYTHSRSWSLGLLTSRRGDVLSGGTSRMLIPAGVFFTRSLSWSNHHPETWAWPHTISMSLTGVIPGRSWR